MKREEKNQIAVIGEKEFTLGFRLVGVKQTYVKENYQEQIKELLGRDDIGILIVDKTDLEELPGRVEQQVNESIDPVVVPLSETGGAGNINEKIKKVIGADITS